MRQGSTKHLRAGRARAGDIVDHVAALRDDAIQRQHGDAITYCRLCGLAFDLPGFSVCHDALEDLVARRLIPGPTAQYGGQRIQALGHQGPRRGQELGQQ